MNWPNCSKIGRELTWNYLKEKWDVVKEKFKGSFLLSFLIEVDPVVIY